MTTSLILASLLALILIDSTGASSRRKYEEKFRSESSDDDDECSSGKKTPKPCPVKKTTTYDYGIVGLGAGGVNLAEKLVDSLTRAGERISVVAFEADTQIGGNVRYAKLVKPDNYSTLVAGGHAYGREMYGDEGPQRVIPITLGIERREVHRLGLDMAYTNWRNEHHLRGMVVRCDPPFVEQTNDGDTTDSSGTAYAFGSTCAESDPRIIGNCGDEENALYRGLYNPDCSQCSNTDLNFGGRGFYGYAWILAGMEFSAVDTFSDLGDGTSYNYDNGIMFGDPQPGNPVTCQVCTPGTNCPYDLAKTTNDDWRTHWARQLSARPVNSSYPLLNYNYSMYAMADNVGFLGDFRREAGARSLSDYNLREYQTNSITGYIPGGMRRLVGRMWKNASDAGMRTFMGEPVRRIDFVTKGPFKYRLETDKQIVLIKKHLFLNLPPFFLQERDVATDLPWVGRFLKGTVIDELRKVEELKAPDPQDVVRILAQWPPGEPAWFWNRFDVQQGNWSFRQFGDTGCFSRTEFLDTPYHRCTNHVVPVYSDDECERIWLGHFEEFRRTNDSAKLMQRVVDEFKTSFPDLADNITNPILIETEYFPSGWHYVKRAYDSKFENMDVTKKAAQPLGAGEPISLIGEAYATSFSGWMEGAFRSAQLALQALRDSSTTSAPLAAAIDAVYEDLFDIFKELDGSVSDASVFSNFAYTPPLYTNPNSSFMLSNEHWWPRNFAGFNTPLDYCNATKAGFRSFLDL